MRIVNDLPEIRAELLLNYLYPEAGSKWIAQNEGSFYRNYNSDLLAFNDERMEVQTARDSFIKLLPQGVLTLDDDMKGEDKAEKFKQIELRLRLLRETFKPIDTFRFRDSLFIEHQVDRLLQDKVSYILKTYFGIDIEQIESPYVREAAMLLPYISRYRGDFGVIANLLQTLFKCEVLTIIGRYSHTDDTCQWLPMVKYELMIPGLGSEEYREMEKGIEPLRDFVSEWFIPFEVWCQIVIKEHNVSQQVDTRLTLGYNTEL